MVKEKRILIYFISWLLGFFLIMFIGISGVFASTYYMNYQYVQQYYDNNGSSVSPVHTNWTESLQSYISANITTVSGSYGAGLSITSPIPILSNHTYTISINFPDIKNIAKSSKNKIAIGNSIDSAAYNYASNNFWCDTVQTSVNNNEILQFVFTAQGPANTVFIPWTTTSTVSQSYFLTEILMEDLGSEGITQNEINNSLNNQTNELNNSIQQSTNTITGEINDMEQSIIDSNKETQDVIKDQLNSCRDSVNLFNENIYTPSATSGYSLKDLQVGKNYTISINSNPNNSNYGFLIKITTGSAMAPDMWETYTNKSATFTYTQAMYDNDYKLYIIDTINYNPISIDTLKSLKIQLQEGSVATQYEPYGEQICQNKIDDTNDKLDGIQGALTDSSTPNTSGLKNSAGWLPAGPLDSILNLPLTMLNSLTSSLGKTCSPLNLTLPYVNKNIQIPCLSAIFAQITGVNGLWTWVGTIASVLILYNYLLNLYAWVDRVLTLRAEFDEAMGADLANWGRL